MTITFARRQLLTASALQEAFDEVVAQLNVQLDLFDTDTVTAAQISDASANGRSLVTAANYAAMKTLLAIAQSDVSGLSATLALKAALASPAFTGTPTAPTATSGTSTTQLATTAFVQGAVAPVVRSASQLLAGEEGIAFDFLSRTAVINDYANTLSSAGRPSDLLTVTRASTKMCVNGSKLLASVAINTLAYDHDPVTGVPKGVLIEPAATNVVLWCRDLTNAAWTKTNCTAAKDQTGPDGVANSASKITASAGNATCLQAIILASSAREQSCYIKRVTGIGVINMTTDNGATWTEVTVTASWTRVDIASQTLANPTVGFRIVTSGDAVAIDFVQNETGSTVTSPIETTTGSVTRSADAVSIAASLFPLNATQGTLFVEAIYPYLGGSGSAGGARLIGSGEYIDLRAIQGGTPYSNSIGYDNSSNQWNTSISPISSNSVIRSAVAWQVNDIAHSVNGSAVQTDASASLPTITTFDFPPSVPFLVRRAAYISRRMVNTELQALTT